MKKNLEPAVFGIQSWRTSQILFIQGKTYMYN